MSGTIFKSLTVDAAVLPFQTANSTDEGNGDTSQGPVGPVCYATFMPTVEVTTGPLVTPTVGT